MIFIKPEFFQCSRFRCFNFAALAGVYFAPGKIDQVDVFSGRQRLYVEMGQDQSAPVLYQCTQSFADGFE